MDVWYVPFTRVTNQKGSSLARFIMMAILLVPYLISRVILDWFVFQFLNGLIAFNAFKPRARCNIFIIRARTAPILCQRRSMMYLKLEKDGGLETALEFFISSVYTSGLSGHFLLELTCIITPKVLVMHPYGQLYWNTSTANILFRIIIQGKTTYKMIFTIIQCKQKGLWFLCKCRLPLVK